MFTFFKSLNTFHSSYSATTFVERLYAVNNQCRKDYIER